MILTRASPSDRHPVRFGSPAESCREPPRDPHEEGDPGGVVFRDKRRIDPETFEARPAPDAPAAAGAAAGAGADAPHPLVAETERVNELTADLQRLSAEYANYRKRVERDREAQRQQTIGIVMADVLPVLDDIGRAREHGELEGGFKAVGESVEAFATKNGVVAFGQVGEPFDPNVHEAMTSDTSADVTEPTVTAVYQVGYRVKDRVIRPARVGVTDAE